MNTTKTLVHDTVEELRRSAYAQPSTPRWQQGIRPSVASTGSGHITATPAFPFDVLTCTGAFSKKTVLVVDMDAVVYDCVRVLRWSAEQFSSCVAEGAAASVNNEAALIVIPTLERLLCCFLNKLRDIIKENKLQVNLVLGNCESALSELNGIDLTSWARERDQNVGMVVDNSFLKNLQQRGKSGDSELAYESCEHVNSQFNSSPKHPATCPTDAPCVPAVKNSSSVCCDPSICEVEKLSLWLQLYQTIVLYFQSSGSNVIEWTSFYTSAKPGWTAATARVKAVADSAMARNQQMFPLLWSTDPRAFFAAAERDAVVSTWVSLCYSELAQLCGRPPPHLLCLPHEGPQLEALLNFSAYTVQSSGSKNVTGRVLVRHGPYTACRLGLRSAAYLPTLYALLAWHDVRRAPDTALNDYDTGAQGFHLSPTEDSNPACGKADTTGAGVVVGAVKKVDAAVRVAQAAALVNRYCGILHVELVSQWIAECNRWGPSAESQADGNSVPLDLATPLWTAQNFEAEVTARGVVVEQHVWAVWVSKEWRYSGPPPLLCHRSRNALQWAVTPAPFCDVSSNYVLDNKDPRSSSNPSTFCKQSTKELQFVCFVNARLSFFRQRVCIVVDQLFSAGPPMRAAGDAEGNTITQKIEAAAGCKVHLSSILAAPFLTPTDTSTTALFSSPLPTCVAAGLTNTERPDKLNNNINGVSTADGGFSSSEALPPSSASTALPTWPAHFQTRATLDEVREELRPSAQLTFVALSLLLCARVLCEADCLRIFAFFLQYLDTALVTGLDCKRSRAARHAQHVNTPDTCTPLAMHGAEKLHTDLHDTPCGVWAWEVAAWWHAVSCVSVLQSVSTCVTRTSQQIAPVYSVGEDLCDAGSVFAGCLPSASYGAADRLSFLAFLIDSHYLLTCDAGAGTPAPLRQVSEDTTIAAGGWKASTKSFAVLTSEEFNSFRQKIHCLPSLNHELAVSHRIWERLGATLSETQR